MVMACICVTNSTAYYVRPLYQTDGPASDSFYINALLSGWDWLIVFSCFTQYLISNSYRLCFGIIYVELLEEFNESSSTTAWIFSFIEATYLGAGMVNIYYTLC